MAICGRRDVWISDMCSLPYASLIIGSLYMLNQAHFTWRKWSHVHIFDGLRESPVVHFSLLRKYLNSSTLVNRDLPYIAQVNFSKSLIKSSDISQVSPRLEKTGIKFGISWSVLIGFTFPIPLKALVLSQPLYACRVKSAVQCFGVKVLAISVMFISRCTFPEPVSNRTVAFSSWQA